ncbi:MAG: hypothetical protein HON90_13700, partial [Halobacteriovoraceae bacterium]|nr:hypothetical protein [Halobacteriovoraceae bacterium]
MKVDYVFILAAGKGSRMGEIGKKVPKVLWPIFEKSLLELQVAYAKYLAPSAKIYINIYNYKTSLLEFIDRNQASFKDVCFIVEESTLDIGGAIHNLANKNDYKGVSLILNSDQFLFCEKEIISQALKNLNNFAHTLFSYDVLTSQGYNALQVRDDCLQGI